MVTPATSAHQSHTACPSHKTARHGAQAGVPRRPAPFLSLPTSISSGGAVACDHMMSHIRLPHRSTLYPHFPLACVVTCCQPNGVSVARIAPCARTRLHLRRSSPLRSGWSISSMMASTSADRREIVSLRFLPTISAYHLIFGSVPDPRRVAVAPLAKR